MDWIKDISDMIPRLNIIWLREVEVEITYEEMMESWKAIRGGADFRKTTLGKKYNEIRRREQKERCFG